MATARLEEGVRGGACCERRPARRGSPACGALIVAVAYRLQKLAQKGDKVGACLTEVRIGSGGRAGSSAAKIGGGEERSSRMNRCRAPPGLREVPLGVTLVVFGLDLSSIMINFD